MPKNQFSFVTHEALFFGLDTAFSNIRFFLGVFALMAFTYLLGVLLARTTNETGPFLSFLFHISWMLLEIYFVLGLLNVSLLLSKGKKVGIFDLFSSLRLFLRFLLGLFLFLGMVFGGLVLFIIPGIIIAIRLRFFAFILIEKKDDAIGSLSKSARITKGHVWNLFVFYLFLIGINILGAFALLVGLILTIPLSLVSTAFVYRKLSS